MGQITVAETAAGETKDTLEMSMLTHVFERPFDWAGRPARISKEHKAQLKRVALRALAVLSMGSLLAAVIALKTAIYVWHLHA
jgi:predicted RNA-binding Zn ribbon-like protein